MLHFLSLTLGTLLSVSNLFDSDESVVLMYFVRVIHTLSVLCIVTRGVNLDNTVCDLLMAFLKPSIFIYTCCMLYTKFNALYLFNHSCTSSMYFNHNTLPMYVPVMSVNA